MFFTCSSSCVLLMQQILNAFLLLTFMKYAVVFSLPKLNTVDQHNALEFITFLTRHTQTHKITTHTKLAQSQYLHETRS